MARTACLCASSSPLIEPWTPLTGSHRGVAMLHEGWWQEKDGALAARMAGA